MMDTLSLNEQAMRYQALDRWFNLPQGVWLAEAFSSELAMVREHLIGKEMLQLGLCGANPWLSILQFRYKYIVTPSFFSKQSNVVASLSLLPFARDSIDCIIAPLTLEFFTGARPPIDEIDRILKPMGHVIFLSVNPFSFWGAALRCGKIKGLDLFSARPVSSFFIKSAMLHRGYRQRALKSFYYIPPVSNPFLIKHLGFLNEMGKMIWPFPPGFYYFIAQKIEDCGLSAQKIPRAVTVLNEEVLFPV